MRTAARILCACLLRAGALGALYTVDDAAPYVGSNGRVVAWDAGPDALALASSSCVRVNARGIFAKPAAWTPRDLPGLGWATEACVPGAGALCWSARGRVLPTAPSPPLYNASAPWPGAGCGRAADGRVLGGGPVYELSACDVLDGGGDLAVCGRAAAYRRTGVADWAYWALCLLAVVMVRSLSYLVVQRVQRARAQADPAWGGQGWAAPAACAGAMGLAAVPGGDAAMVTREEALLFWAVFAYTGMYLALYATHCLAAWEPAPPRPADGPVLRALRAAHEAARAWLPTEAKADPPVYNMISGALQLIAMRLYGGAETPYNPVVVWAIATRALVKLRGAHAGVEGLSAVVDGLLLSALCAIGNAAAAVYLVALYAAALATSDIFC